MDGTKAGHLPGGKGGGGEIHGPENHSGRVRIDTFGGQDAADFGPITGKIAARVWDAEAKDNGAASRPSHVVEADAGVKVVAAASASSNGGSVTVAATG